MTQPVLLIAGAGDLGSRLASRRAVLGDSVITLRRSQTSSADVGIRSVAADLIGGQGLHQLPRRVDAVVFCATPDRREESAYRSLFIDGVSRLLSAFDIPPRRFVFVSSTAVYGEDAGEWIDEDTPARPAAFNGQVLLEAEQALAEACAGAVALRLTGLYGPGRSYLLRRALSGDPGHNRWSNRIHVEDAALAVSHVLDLAEAEPVYIGTDDLPTRDFEVLNWLRQRHGMAETAPPVEPDTGRRARNRRLRASGWQPRFADFRSGYEAVLTGS
jgi:electron-transferring-flavoprotein dehydrogenase